MVKQQNKLQRKNIQSKAGFSWSKIAFVLIILASVGIGFFLLRNKEAQNALPFQHVNLTNVLDFQNDKNWLYPSIAYITPWNSKGYQYVTKNINTFSHVVPVWFALKATDKKATTFKLDGLEQIQQNKEWLKQIQGLNKRSSSQHKVKVCPRILFELSSGPEFFQALQNKQTIDLIQKTIQNDFQGVTLEMFITSMPQFRVLIEAFVDSLSAVLQKDQKEIILVVPFQAQGNQADMQFYEVLSRKGVNLFSVNTYDITPTNIVGPVAPINIIENYVKTLKNQKSSDASKICLGVNFYGREYTVSGNKKPTSEAKVSHDLVNLLNNTKLEASLTLEKETMEYKIEYQQQNAQKVFYISVPPTICYKKCFAEKNGMGIAVWEVGQGTQSMVDALSCNCTKHLR